MNWLMMIGCETSAEHSPETINQHLKVWGHGHQAPAVLSNYHTEHLLSSSTRCLDHVWVVEELHLALPK